MNVSGSTAGYSYSVPENRVKAKEFFAIPINPEKLLYNGSTERAVLTGEQVTELAKKYDPEHMTQEQYRNYLDDLQNYGVISEQEKLDMGYNPGSIPLGYADGNGEWVSSFPNVTVEEVNLDDAVDLNEIYSLGLFGSRVRLGADGNLLKVLMELGKVEIAKVTASGSPTRTLEAFAEQEQNLRDAMTDTTNLVMERRRTLAKSASESASKPAEPAETRQLPNLMEQEAATGGVWLEMRNVARQSEKKTAR